MCIHNVSLRVLGFSDENSGDGNYFHFPIALAFEYPPVFPLER